MVPKAALVRVAEAEGGVDSANELRLRLRKVADEFASALNPRVLTPGQDYIPASGKVVGKEEFAYLLEAACDMHLTAGRFAEEFESRFAKTTGFKHSLLVNSGSSANLLALSALTSASLGDRALRPGDEMITVACGFPTTVAPAVQYGLVPVFIDVDLRTQSPLISQLEKALSPKTKVVMIAHALGNPFPADQVAAFCKKHGLWFVEDCCDALGAEISGKKVGSFGHLATFSFYPAHHITMGEGGAVCTNHSQLFRIGESMRDWGRDCWCPPGKSDTCGKRFGWQMGTLPEGYDHKYIYSHLGFNLKSTDFQAALGLAQLGRLAGFVEARKENHRYLAKKLRAMGLEKHFHLPESVTGSNPSWFGFLLVCKEAGKRTEMVRALEKAKVGTRLLFAGNLTRHPAFQDVQYRICGDLTTTDNLTENAFWVGVWPGLKKEHLDYIAEALRNAV